MIYKNIKQRQTEYFYNYLHFLSQGQIPESLLRKIEYIEIEDNIIRFYFMERINTKDWKWCYGTSSHT